MMTGTHCRFDGEVALVTGGARNIGLAVAMAFAAEGASVAIADICEDLETVPYKMSSKLDLKKAEEELSRMNKGMALGLVCDVRQERQVEALVRKTIERFGRLDILVNNAGVVSFSPLERLSEKAWNEILDICLNGYGRR